MPSAFRVRMQGEGVALVVVLLASEFPQKSETSGSDVFRRFQTISDVIQTISDRPDLQSADICRPRSDVCDLPV